eukprot:6192351-Pleurochrysis_carterae.AAC.5
MYDRARGAAVRARREREHGGVDCGARKERKAEWVEGISAGQEEELACQNLEHEAASDDSQGVGWWRVRVDGSVSVIGASACGKGRAGNAFFNSWMKRRADFVVSGQRVLLMQSFSAASPCAWAGKVHCVSEFGARQHEACYEREVVSGASRRAESSR